MDTIVGIVRRPRASRAGGGRGAAASEAAFVVPLAVLFSPRHFFPDYTLTGTGVARCEN